MLSNSDSDQIALSRLLLSESTDILIVIILMNCLMGDSSFYYFEEGTVQNNREMKTISFTLELLFVWISLSSSIDLLREYRLSTITSSSNRTSGLG